MKIHETKECETLSEIAEKYGICEGELKETNGIGDGKTAIGEELLILYPTRIHTARQGDTLERICIRYRVRKNDVLALNPSLCTKTPDVGQRIVLKYDERSHGMAAANGYIYKGTQDGDLRRVMPFMTYATFACAFADERGIHKLFDETSLLNMVRAENKIPILKIHDSFKERYKSATVQDSFCKEIIELAKKGGYKGILLNAAHFSKSAENYSAFLLNLKKKLIGSDLILLTECDAESPREFNEIADGSILSYTRLFENNVTPFELGEKKTIADFACDCESIKSFIELPAFAMLGDGFTEITSANKTARLSGARICLDEPTLTKWFDTKGGRCVYPSLRSIKAALELMSEYGYMGISFDVMRTPSVYLSMYNAMFKTVNYTASLSREGCSRE